MIHRCEVRWHITGVAIMLGCMYDYVAASLLIPNCFVTNFNIKILSERETRIVQSACINPQIYRVEVNFRS